MTRPEIAAILKMTAGGHSKADPTVMDLWLQCAHSARWTYVEAHAAVIVHMTTSSDYITPAHLTAIIRATRQDTAMRETAERESVVNPDAAARVRRMCAEFGERNYSMSDDTVVHPRGLHVDCPNTVCGAKRGDPCKHPTRRVTGFVHPSRQDAEQKYIQEHK